MLRKSLSSDAAAALATAFARAADGIGSLAPSNQTVASGRPPSSLQRSRMIRAESIRAPGAALAKVLARSILAYLIGVGERSANFGRLSAWARASASGEAPDSDLSLSWARALPPGLRINRPAPVSAPRNSVRRSTPDGVPIVWPMFRSQLDFMIVVLTQCLRLSIAAPRPGSLKRPGELLAPVRSVDPSGTSRLECIHKSSPERTKVKPSRGVQFASPYSFVHDTQIERFVI